MATCRGIPRGACGTNADGDKGSARDELSRKARGFARTATGGLLLLDETLENLARLLRQQHREEKPSLCCGKFMNG
jgi:hypothetical protein